MDIPLEPVQNYLRLQHGLNYIALPMLQRIFKEKWKANYQSEWKNSEEQGLEFVSSIGSSLFKDASKIRKNLLNTGDIQKWDIPLIIGALKCFNKPTKTKSKSDKSWKELLKGFNKLVDVRNQLSHHGGLEINNKLFEQLWNSTSEALIIFGITKDNLDKANIVSVRKNKKSINKAQILKGIGNSHLKNNKFELAAEKYTDAIRQPGLPSKELAILHSNRSLAYLKLGHYYKAKEDAIGATFLNPNCWRVFGRLGHVYLSVDKYTQALVNFEKAIELDPDCKLQNERDHCRNMIEKIKQDEHLDPMNDATTSEQMATKIVDEQKISPLAVNTMKNRISLSNTPSEMCTEECAYQHRMKKEYEIAAKWFARAAAEGSAAGYYNLASLCIQGKGVNRDVAESIRLLKIAASQAICIDSLDMKRPDIAAVRAEHSLGVMYHRGIGVPQDSRKAFAWYTSAIKHGSGQSAYNVGGMYFIGVGVQKDAQIALNYFKLGAAMNVVRAMEKIAATYCQLLDKENTRKWYQFAISKGSLSIQSERERFFALVGNELDMPIEKDVFELELLEEVKNGPLAHLFAPSSPEDLMLKLMIKSLDAPSTTSRSSLGFADPYRIQIIKTHRTVLRQHRNRALKYENGEGNFLPRTSVEGITLKLILFADMDPYKAHIYEECAINLTFIEDAITGRPPIMQIAEDEKGDAQRIFIYNFPQDDETQKLIGFGRKVTLVNPHFRLVKGVKPMICVDDISLMFLHTCAIDEIRCRYCGKECKLTVPCRRCKRAYYCSKLCLINDAMELSHEDVCLRRL